MSNPKPQFKGIIFAKVTEELCMFATSPWWHPLQDNLLRKEEQTRCLFCIKAPVIVRFRFFKVHVILQCTASMRSQFNRARKLTQLITKFSADRLRENKMWKSLKSCIKNKQTSQCLALVLYTSISMSELNRKYKTNA